MPKKHASSSSKKQKVEKPSGEIVEAVLQSSEIDEKNESSQIVEDPKNEKMEVFVKNAKGKLVSKARSDAAKKRYLSIQQAKLEYYELELVKNGYVVKKPQQQLEVPQPSPADDEQAKPFVEDQPVEQAQVSEKQESQCTREEGEILL